MHINDVSAKNEKETLSNITDRREIKPEKSYFEAAENRDESISRKAPRHLLSSSKTFRIPHYP